MRCRAIPNALQFLDPSAWIWFWKTEPYYKSRVVAALVRSEREPVRFPATVTRER